MIGDEIGDGGDGIIEDGHWISQSKLPRYRHAEANIEFRQDAQALGSVLVATSPDVKEPVAARYAWKNAPEANLYNGAGLPAVPFRTDNW